MSVGTLRIRRSFLSWRSSTWYSFQWTSANFAFYLDMHLTAHSNGKRCFGRVELIEAGACYGLIHDHSRKQFRSGMSAKIKRLLQAAVKVAQLPICLENAVAQQLVLKRHYMNRCEKGALENCTF